MTVDRSAAGLALFFLVASSLLTAYGCLPQASIPMPMLEYGPMDAFENKNLLILLRGLDGSLEDFVGKRTQPYTGNLLANQSGIWNIGRHGRKRAGSTQRRYSEGQSLFNTGSPRL